MIVTPTNARRILRKYYGPDFPIRLTTKQHIGTKPLSPGSTLAWSKLTTGRDSAVRIGKISAIVPGEPIVVDWSWCDDENAENPLAFFVRHVATRRWYTFRCPPGPQCDIEQAEQWPTLAAAAEIASQLTRTVHEAYEAVSMLRYRLHERRDGETWTSVELYAATTTEIRQAVLAGFCGIERWATTPCEVICHLDGSGKQKQP